LIGIALFCRGEKGVYLSPQLSGVAADDGGMRWLLVVLVLVVPGVVRAQEDPDAAVADREPAPETGMAARRGQREAFIMGRPFQFEFGIHIGGLRYLDAEGCGDCGASVLADRFHGRSEVSGGASLSVGYRVNGPGPAALFVGYRTVVTGVRGGFAHRHLLELNLASGVFGFHVGAGSSTWRLGGHDRVRGVALSVEPTIPFGKRGLAFAFPVHVDFLFGANGPLRAVTAAIGIEWFPTGRLLFGD
tara:strand:- start:2435 stop:3172 length:738 start_codon:yes stop_codon:yes gene_type:complete